MDGWIDKPGLELKSQLLLFYVGIFLHKCLLVVVKQHQIIFSLCSSVRISGWRLRCLWCPAEDLRLDDAVKSLCEQLAAISGFWQPGGCFALRMVVGFVVNKNTHTVCFY